MKLARITKPLRSVQVRVMLAGDLNAELERYAQYYEHVHGRNLEKSVALERLHVTGRHELALVHDQPRRSRGHIYGMRR